METPDVTANQVVGLLVAIAAAVSAQFADAPWWARLGAAVVVLVVVLSVNVWSDARIREARNTTVQEHIRADAEILSAGRFAASTAAVTQAPQPEPVDTSRLRPLRGEGGYLR